MNQGRAIRLAGGAGEVVRLTTTWRPSWQPSRWPILTLMALCTPSEEGDALSIEVDMTRRGPNPAVPGERIADEDG